MSHEAVCWTAVDLPRLVLQKWADDNPKGKTRDVSYGTLKSLILRETFISHLASGDGRSHHIITVHKPTFLVSEWRSSCGGTWDHALAVGSDNVE